MKKRMILMLLVTATFLAAIGFFKFRQVQAAIAQSSSFQPPPEAVTTIVARREVWQPTLKAIGSVTAVNGVIVGADLPGIVERIAFDSGDPVREGEVLVQLDARQEEAQLAAAKARLELTRLHLDRIQGLLRKGVSSRAEHDSAVAEHDQAVAIVGEIEATLQRKTVRAPFSGILGIRQVNLGQYLDSGEPIVPLQSMHPIYVDFDVPQQEIDHVRPGGAVRVEVEGETPGEIPGTIAAVDSVVNEATRNVRVRATFENPHGALRPGMFVTAHIVLDERQDVVPIPASSIQYAPYGNSAFVVGELEGPGGARYKGVTQRFVKLGAGRGDQIAVISGIESGDEVVTSGLFKLRNGAAVQVNNEVQPGNDPAPRPEDN